MGLCIQTGLISRIELIAKIVVNVQYDAKQFPPYVEDVQVTQLEFKIRLHLLYTIVLNSDMS